MPRFKLHTVLLACLGCALFAAPAQAYSPFQTGIHEPNAGGGNAALFDRIQGAKASTARISVLWTNVAPHTSAKPAGFDPRNPGDPNYTWTDLDAFVRASADRGIAPLVTVYNAPPWATETAPSGDFDAGTYRPSPKEFGDFMFAMATRYSGSYTPPGGATLPRVKYFQMWNEPNFGLYLTSAKQSEIPVVYAKLLNAGYDAVKSVSRSNLVITGGLGPFGRNSRASDVEPQFFMRELLCLTGSGGRKLKDKRGCKVPTPKFDAWAQHPYTFGGEPTTEGGNVDSAALGDMDEIAATLKFAVRKKNVAPRGNKRLWVTEFGWFSNPPGVKAGDGRELGLSLPRQAAFLSESAYRLWRDGFSAFVWYQINDSSAFPSGLSFANGEAKPALEAFKFPFYAESRGSRTLVWGLASRAGKVTIRVEKKSGSRYKKVADVRSDGQGMIYRKIKGGRGTYRARVLTGAAKGSTSRSFSRR